ncbi:TonB-dependent receptor [Catenovulum adriaticum]|uniref:TonB-dependent receptor n=1 Tax=Catenovulum adriaticum TaxID=2984846 RepID=A0ABY7ARZ2_9ALTE|nr:TonB-dependent receptor [Catenovulum sp. TS8]WAJ71547.1 TonB-dependent receptor [Catenovulum sp. TS8]
MNTKSTFIFIFYGLLLTAKPALAKSEIKDVIKVEGEKTTYKTNYTLLQRSDFLSKGSSLSDIIQKQTGVQIRQVGGIGNQVSVSIRGSTHKQVQFYIDGQLINSGQFGGFDLNQLPLEQIQSIEISKSQAVDTGSTPIGGVIKINTLDPNKNQTRISGAIGSFNLAQLSAVKSVQLGGHQMSANLSYLTTANNYPYHVPAPLNNPQQSTEEKLRNNDYQKLSAYINDSFVIGDHKIKASFQFTGQDKKLPSYRNNSNKNKASLDTNTRRSSLSDDWLVDHGLIERISAEAYVESKKEIYWDKFISTKPKRYDYKTDTQAINLSALVNLNAIKATPYLKFSDSEYQSESANGKQGKGCNGVSSCDIIAQQTQMHLGSRFEFNQNNWSAHLLLNQLFDDNSNQLNQQTEFEFEPKNNHNNYFSFDSSLSYQLNQQFFSINAAKGLRTPSLFERYGDRGMLKGNDDLSPEASSTFSFAYAIQSKNWQLDSSLYTTQLEDAIIAIYNSSGVGSYQNISKAQILGFELTSQYQISSQFDLLLNLTLQDSNTDSIETAYDNKMLPGIYHEQYQVEIKYQPIQAFNLSLSASHDKALYISRANIDDSQAKRTLVDINSQYQMNNWRFALQILNLSDQRYQNLANRPAVGRSFKLSVTFNYE